VTPKTFEERWLFFTWWRCVAKTRTMPSKMGFFTTTYFSESNLSSTAVSSIPLLTNPNLVFGEFCRVVFLCATKLVFGGAHTVTVMVTIWDFEAVSFWPLFSFWTCASWVSFSSFLKFTHNKDKCMLKLFLQNPFTSEVNLLNSLTLCLPWLPQCCKHGTPKCAPKCSDNRGSRFSVIAPWWWWVSSSLNNVPKL